MAVDAIRFVQWSREMAEAGDSFGAAVICFVGSIHARGDATAMQRLALLAQAESESDDKNDVWPSEVDA